MSGGRPTKLTPEMAAELIECIELGMSREGTADYCGIAESTLRAWLADAEGEFSAALKRAEGRAERRLLQVLHENTRALKDDQTAWQPAAWILERRFRDRWGRHEKVEHSGAVATGPLDDETRKRIVLQAAAEYQAEADE